MPEDFKPLLKPFEEEPSQASRSPSSSSSAAPVLSAVPGFWGRTGAFLLDGALLIFISYMAANYAYENLYPMRWVCQPAVAILVFVYFWIGSSGLSKGQTVGKFVFGYRTIALDRDGAPSAGQAALRALLVQSIVLVYVFFRVPPRSPDPSRFFFGATTLLHCLATAYTLANAVFCGLHPKRFSLHDLLTHTAVVRSTEKHRALEFYKEWDENCRAKVKLAIYPSVCLAPIVGLLFGYGFVDNRDRIVRDLRNIQTARQNLDLAGFHLLAVVGPSLEDRKRFEETLEKGEAMLLGEMDESGTAGSETPTRDEASPRDRAQSKEDLLRRIEEFRKFGRDGRKFIYFFDCDDSQSTPSLTADPRYLDLLAQLPRATQVLAWDHFTGEEGKPLPYHAIQVEFHEILPLYLHAEIRMVFRKLLPLDAPGESDLRE